MAWTVSSSEARLVRMKSTLSRNPSAADSSMTSAGRTSMVTGASLNATRMHADQSARTMGPPPGGSVYQPRCVTLGSKRRTGRRLPVNRAVIPETGTVSLSVPFAAP